MKVFEVTILYRGERHYYVEAETTDDATEIARERYREGDNGDPDGSEWEEIEEITANQANVEN